MKRNNELAELVEVVILGVLAVAVAAGGLLGTAAAGVWAWGEGYGTFGAYLVIFGIVWLKIVIEFTDEAGR